MMTTRTGLDVCVDLTSKYSNVSYRLVVVLRNLDSDLYNYPTPPSRFEEWHSPMKLKTGGVNSMRTAVLLGLHHVSVRNIKSAS